MGQDSEKDRLARLRERQLEARNPRKAEQQFMRTVARRQKRKNKPVTLSEMIRGIPHQWQGVFLGIIIGAIVLLILPLLWESRWAETIGILAIVIFAVFGFAYGQALDVRDELRDFKKRK
ncbi:MAG: DUF3784 domain-containing protein [Anaerolineales bacterium]|nr:DUF3784 domain-containing protein [Anaerolineales bacterium]